ncbi:MAG: HNH endonuclease signature motif containing protein [bacterium]
MKNLRLCAGCGTQLLTRHKIKFCSNKCQCDLKYRTKIDLWKKGELGGGVGITARNLAAWLRKYLIEKYNNKCFFCGWNKKHPLTGVVPLEVDHIDGNSENNLEKNLRLLCPNCHALTPYYKNMNKGKGRKWRMKKYIKN